MVWLFDPTSKPVSDKLPALVVVNDWLMYPYPATVSVPGCFDVPTVSVADQICVRPVPMLFAGQLVGLIPRMRTSALSSDSAKPTESVKLTLTLMRLPTSAATGM